MRQRKFFLSPENDIKYNWKNTNERRLYYNYKYEYYIKKKMKNNGVSFKYRKINIKAK